MLFSYPNIRHFHDVTYNRLNSFSGRYCICVEVRVLAIAWTLLLNRKYSSEGFFDAGTLGSLLDSSTLLVCDLRISSRTQEGLTDYHITSRSHHTMQFIHVSQNLQINFFPNLNCDDAKFIHYHDRQRSYNVLHNKIPFKCWGQIASPYSTAYTGADNFVFMAKLLMPHLTLSIIEFPESGVKNT